MHDELDKEFRLAEGHFLRFNENYKIQSIDLVRNKKLERKFEAKQDELKRQGKGECLLLFHGTKHGNIQTILVNNFDVSIVANRKGVYFSEYPEVSMGNSDYLKSLILCKVLTGNNSSEVKNEGHEFFWATTIEDIDQILPKYVIYFT